MMMKKKRKKMMKKKEKKKKKKKVTDLCREMARGLYLLQVVALPGETL